MSRSVRDHCAAQLLTRTDLAEHLLSALENGRVAPRELTAAARAQLRQTGSRAMRVRAERVLHSAGSKEKQALVDDYLAQFDASADLGRGEQLFAQHCAVCHVPDAAGRAVGASLNNLTDRSDRALVEAILDPNAAAEPQYQSHLIQTTDDRILAGVIEEEAGQSITLAHADGQRTTVRRSEIRELKNTGVSLMPEGLEQTLPPADLQAIVRYVQSGVEPPAATRASQQGNH